ncbi:hypothetical protein QQF54_08640 [Lelliottia sp. V106_10]|uniref:hypothetical protein n=1 Tax=Lelliottia wanjuensis TaxID=3050585 RepID=UPI00254DB013|nr:MULTISPECIES: hypothetical protein [unclassified Lelliottia]MDK9356731.1 hypothetical protein [Lelliottia sp. V106_16]MDK9373421.1 hypothetical protein [Lelliottia sp. V106_10]MDK9600214.1 hypothetical protein [Lelliottia sp. V106_5]
MHSYLLNERIDKVITYKDIAEKGKGIKEAETEYVEKIHSTVNGLMYSYVQNLQLQETSWRDLNGREYPYAFITKEKGSFTPIDPFSLRVDMRDGVSFQLATVTDDDPRDYRSVAVTVTVAIVSGTVKITVGGHKEQSFYLTDSGDKYLPVCNFIKDAVIMRLNSIQVGMTEENEKY